MKRLPYKIIRAVEAKLSTLFDAIKFKFLGQRGVDKVVHMASNRDESLLGMYELASREHMGIPQVAVMESLINTSKNYLDALRLKTSNKVIKDLEEKLHSSKSITPEILAATLNENLEIVKAEVRRIIETETQAAKNIGTIDGILRSAAAMNIEDPEVMFIPTRDDKTCDECIKVHLGGNGKPKVFKVSKISAGYHKKGNDLPSLHGIHPNCRCQIVWVKPKSE